MDPMSCVVRQLEHFDDHENEVKFVVNAVICEDLVEDSEDSVFEGLWLVALKRWRTEYFIRLHSTVSII